MAYSTNPFSVATFGESYEQADASFSLTGVAGTGAIGTPDISSRTNVNLTGVQGNGTIGAPTPQAEATTGALTGVEATGATNTVTATGGTGVVFTPNSVSATGSVDDVIIVAKAVVIPTGIEVEIITDDPLVIGDEIVVDAEADISLTGIAGTGGTGSPTIISQAVVIPTGVEGDIITDSILVDGDEVVIDAEADVALDGVGGTTGINDNFIFICKAVVIPTGVQGTFTVGNETIDAVQFDYEAVKENYSRDRTAYIGEYSTLGNTVYVRAA